MGMSAVQLAVMAPTMSVLEIITRGTITFLMLYILMRLVGRRESASVGMTDVLVIVLVADAASTGMNGNSQTLGDGFILVIVILFWSLFIDAMSYKFRWFRKLMKASPRALVQDGNFVRRTLRREFMTKDEVMTQLRLHGVEDVSQVHRAYLEPNGSISIVTDEEDDDAKRSAAQREQEERGEGPVHRDIRPSH